jgi:hypothetical protein
MEHGSIVESSEAPGPSENGPKRVGSHHSLLALPNSVGYRANDPIPYRLTLRGMIEVAAYRVELRARLATCQHPRLTYDHTDQVYACDDCGSVYAVVWLAGRAYLGDRL